MKSTFWDTRATDSIIKSSQKDTEASILTLDALWKPLTSVLVRVLTYSRMVARKRAHCQDRTVASPFLRPDAHSIKYGIYKEPVRT